MSGAGTGGVSGAGAGTATGLRPIFGVGCPRSGTTTFATQMSQIAGIHSLHEGIVVGEDASNQLSYLFQSTNLSSGEEAWNRRAIAERLELAKQVHPLRICDSNNTLSMNLHLVQEYFPDAKIIHLVRPPVEQVISRLPAYINAFNTGKKAPPPRPNRSTWTNVTDSVTWLPHGNLVELAAKVWQVQNETIAKTTLPRIVVETKDLSSHETWVKILDFCEIEAPVPRLDIVANVGNKKHRNTSKYNKASHYCSVYCTWKWK